MKPKIDFSTLCQQLDSDIDISVKLDLLKEYFEFETSYMQNMSYAIEQAKNGDSNYQILGNSVEKLNNLENVGLSFQQAIDMRLGSLSLKWTINHALGELILWQERCKQNT